MRSKQDSLVFKRITMDALIKISSSEFNEELYKKIKSLIKSLGSAEVTIAFSNKTDGVFRNESDQEYLDRLNKSSRDIEQGKGITFTMEELDAYINHIPAK